MIKCVDWKNVAADQVVCYCSGVTKEQILRAINSGAKSIDEIARSTGAGTGRECAVRNPSGRCCRIDIRGLLETFTPHQKPAEGCI